jgi:hypothetical protein
MLRVAYCAACATSALAFIAPRRAPKALLASRHVVPIRVDAFDDATTARLIEVELVEMLDREWIEQDCHQILGRRAGAAYLAARGRGLDDVGSVLQYVGDALTADREGFDEAYVGPWDVANFVADVLVTRANADDGDRCACSASPPAADLERRAAELGSAS